jgi:hypothetical protein
MKCPSLSHLTNVSLNSTLSDISVATPACFGGAIGLVNLLLASHPKPGLFLSVKWVSHKQQIVGSSFLIQLTKHCLLMGELSPLTFSVNTDRYVVIPAI